MYKSHSNGQNCMADTMKPVASPNVQFELGDRESDQEKERLRDDLNFNSGDPKTVQSHPFEGIGPAGIPFHFSHLDFPKPIEKYFGDLADISKSKYRGKHPKTTIQGKVYNFLERPSGWKCFVYHFVV